MIYVVIGQSGSGKTTYVLNRWLKVGRMETLTGYPVPVTRCGNVRLIGVYDLQRRELGTDKLPYNSVAKVLDTIDLLVAEGAEIVMEGDRINNSRVFEHLVRHKYPFKLILCRCSIQTSLNRLRAAGSSITPQFVKATATKSRRNFLTYSGRSVEAEVVDT